MSGAHPHTVIVRTRRMAELAEFYRAGLGWDEPQATGDDHLGFPTPTVYFGLDQVDEPPAAPGPVSVWFEVEDLEASFARFVELGA